MFEYYMNYLPYRLADTMCPGPIEYTPFSSMLTPCHEMVIAGVTLAFLLGVFGLGLVVGRRAVTR